MKARPNILLIMTDQQSASALGCAGNTDLKTPVIDRLAGRGVRFNRAYCPFPLCTPARGSLFSGLMPHQCGTMRNGQEIEPPYRAREMGTLLSAAGYHCAYGGKWHVAPIAMPAENDHGFEVIAGFNDQVLADACNGFFRRQRKADQPFFLVASFDNPHNICEFGRHMPLPWARLPAPPPTDQMPNLPSNFDIPAFAPEIIRTEQELNYPVYPTLNGSPDEWRRLRWGYFRLVEWVDRQIGRVLDSLRRAGLEQDTVVIFTSDHGDGHGAHRCNQKSMLYEEIIRVPLIVHDPAGVSGKVSPSLVNNALDVYATVLDYAGVKAPLAMPGCSLRAPAAGRRPVRQRDRVFVETSFDWAQRGYGTTGRSVIEDRYKYTVYDKGLYRECLVDLERDPGEMVNLAVEARYAGRVRQFRRRLQQWVVSTHDGFRVPGYADGHAGRPAWQVKP